MEENMIAIRDLKTFRFNFDFPKDDDESLKREIEFTRKSKESLSKIIVKTKDYTLEVHINMLLLKIYLFITRAKK